MFTKTKTFFSVVALVIAAVISGNTIVPKEVDTQYAAQEKLQSVDGEYICHLRDEGWCGFTNFGGENINYEGLAGLKVQCNKTKVNYTMYTHTKPITEGKVTVQRGESSIELGNVKIDETKSFDIKTAAKQMGLENTVGVYTLSLKVDLYKEPVDINMYYNGSKVQVCWVTNCSQYHIDRWNKLVANLDPETCLDMWVGNKNNPLTYPTSGTNGNCNHVQEWCDLSDEIIIKPEWSNETKVCAMVLYLVRNYAYDDYRVQTLKNVSRANTDDAWTDDNHFMFYNKVGQCWDFANVLTIMCRHQGIPCTSVENYDHTVNAVWMNGEWVAIDVSALVAHHCNTKDTDPKLWLEYHTDSYENAYGYYDGTMDTYNQALATPETTLSNRSGKNPM